jgi:hypothetical protein
MSYKLNKTDGSLLIELVDGRIDNSSSNLTLVGKNYQGFGEFINENFIKLLENFSNSTQPNKPLRGQLWYDTSENRLKVYNGTEFKSTDTTIYASTRPSNLNQGDIWIDGSNDQLYFWNGTEALLVGPGYTKTQLKSGHFVETIKDTTGQNKVIIKLFINGVVVGIYAKDAFTPFPAITGFTNLSVGFNISSAYNNYKFLGTATNAENLINTSGVVYNPLDIFLRKDTALGDQTVGRIVINNNDGLLISGSSADLELRTSGTNAVIRTNTTNSDLFIALKDSTGSFNAVTFDTEKTGLIDPGSGGTKTGFAMAFGKNHTPSYNFDFDGDVRVTGSLIIDGDVTSLDVTTLRVQDHQIELAITDDSTLPDDTAVDQAGIIVRVTGDDKYLLWQLDTNKWDLSTGLNVVDPLGSFSIDDAQVLSKTTLGSSVVNSSLTSLGTLSSLTVDNLFLDSNRITSTNTLEISAVGTVDFLSQPKIINVGTPISARISALGGGTPAEDDDDFVATKGYVDGELNAVTEVMGMDITGLGTGAALQTNVAIMLEELYPAITKSNGSIARIHTSAMTATTNPIDVNSNVSKTFTAVDSAGVQNVSVVGDFSISSPTATVSLTVTRTIMEYKVVAGLWTYQSTTASAV